VPDPKAAPIASEHVSGETQPAGIALSRVGVAESPVRRVALHARAARPDSPGPDARAPEHAGVTPPRPPTAQSASVDTLPAFPDAATLAAAPRQVAGRPEPTRAATLAAYRNAMAASAPPAAAPLAPRVSVAAPAIAPVLAVARWPTPPPMTRPVPLARVETIPTMQNGGRPQEAAQPEPPDLDALADHVLERLRHELRDGRERLGYLLDDLR
jgi:hypothetical protein